MRTDAENDTRSPWYEAFALHSHPQSDGAASVAGALAVAEIVAQVQAVEPDSSTEALFDCYNG